MLYLQELSFINYNLMEPNNNKKIIILVPLTIPSSGKTISFQKLKQHQDFHIEIVSSDKCREEVMNEIKTQNPNLTQKDLFSKSGKKAKERFSQYLTENFKKFQTSQKSNCILILDKNHPQNALKSTVEEINRIIGKNNKEVKIVGLIPSCSQTFSSHGNFYPFSLEYLITCIKRSIQRQQHQTLLGSQVERATIVLSFFNMFRGFRFDKQTLGKYFDSTLSLKMFNEEIPTFTNEIKNLLVQTLSSSKPGSFNESPFCGALVNQLKQVIINQIPLEALLEDNKKKINEMFANFSNLQFQENE